MADFPKLKTGAVAQYPASVGTQFATRVMRFVDGSEQRWQRFGAPLWKWTISLSQLDETETAAIEAFFESHKGRFETFTFEDPWTGETAVNCTFEHDDLTLVFSGESHAATKLVIRENRS